VEEGGRGVERVDPLVVAVLQEDVHGALVEVLGRLVEHAVQLAVARARR
jgi:hypothetical protein